MRDTAFMGVGALQSGLRWEEYGATSSVHACIVGSLSGILAQLVDNLASSLVLCAYSCILPISL